MSTPTLFNSLDGGPQCDARSAPVPMPVHRYGFLLVGPNASGKTTTVERVLAHWREDGRVAAVLADERNRKDFTGDLDNMSRQLQDGPWASAVTVLIVSGTNYIAKAAGLMQARAIAALRGDAITGGPERQQAAVGGLLGSSADVVLVEGIDRTARAAVAGPDHGRSLEVLITTQEPAVMRAHLQARCAKAGKRFRADYWTDRALAYEGQRRYRGLAQTYYPDATFWPIGLHFEGQDALVAHLINRITACLAS